jgi:hypothetical protein
MRRIDVIAIGMLVFLTGGAVNLPNFTMGGSE